MSEVSGTKYRVMFNTTASVTVDLVVPDHVDEFDAEDWAADNAHDIATEEIATWGVYGRARLDMDLDGIGADSVEKADD